MVKFVEHLLVTTSLYGEFLHQENHKVSESSKEVANTLYPSKNVYISELLQEEFTSFIPLHID